MSDILDNVWMRVEKMSGRCAANMDIEDLKSGVKSAQEKIDKAVQAGQFMQSNSQILGNLKQANDKLGKVSKALDLMSDFCIDINASNKILDAVKSLDKMEYINEDPNKAAAAFGQLFVGVGLLCRHVPALKEWGQFFSQSGVFFVNVGKGVSMSTEMNQHKWQTANTDPS